VSANRKRPEIAPWGRRLPTQLFGLLLFNGYFWAPAGKYLCLPVLNCYACPIGTVSCPIGSLSAFALVRRMPYYIIGLLVLLGLTLGRGFCGWACPFGFLQDLLHRIRSPKWRLPRAADGLKYALLAVLVIGLPLALGGGRDLTGEDRIVAEGTGALDYCALVCPAGTLEAGLPTLATESIIRAQATWRTWSKIGILVGVLGLVVVSRRAFCRALCPLGALMALSSRMSALRLRTDLEKCTKCDRCVAVCPTASRQVPEQPGQREATAECVMCLDCVRACPQAGALSAQWAGRTVSLSEGERDV
jgi:ferredoxin-type protein NapH